MNVPALIIDPRWFHPDAIAPETAAFNTKVQRALADGPTVIEMGAAKTRALRNDGRSPFDVQFPTSTTAVDRQVFHDGRSVNVRCFRPTPDGPLAGAYLHIHGGGWCLGAANHQDAILQPVADTLGIAVISVDYRLAPEHPFPAGPDDCETAARWLLGPGADQLGTERLAIGGESAGAHLAALTLLRLRDASTERATGFRGANLVYGAYDLTLTPSARRWGPTPLILSTPIVEWFSDQFLPPSLFGPEQRRAPHVSPMYADLEGLPPALFTIGTRDALLDDSLMMAARWTGAGNAAQLAVYPGGIHGFDMMLKHPLARRSHRQQTNFIGEVLGLTPSVS